MSIVEAEKGRAALDDVAPANQSLTGSCESIKDIYCKQLALALGLYNAVNGTMLDLHTSYGKMIPFSDGL